MVCFQVMKCLRTREGISKRKDNHIFVFFKWADTFFKGFS